MWEVGTKSVAMDDLPCQSILAPKATVSSLLVNNSERIIIQIIMLFLIKIKIKIEVLVHRFIKMLKIRHPLSLYSYIVKYIVNQTTPFKNAGKDMIILRPRTKLPLPLWVSMMYRISTGMQILVQQLIWLVPQVISFLLYLFMEKSKIFIGNGAGLPISHVEILS